jgi:DNA-binding CsgD family transcriptional regulator
MQQVEIARDKKVFSGLFAGQGTHPLYTYYLTSLISWSQSIYGAEEHLAQQLATQIATISQNTIQFHPHRQRTTDEAAMLPYIANRRALLVQWEEEIYGTLQCIVKEEYATILLPPALCERLARDCAWCLYLLEREASLQQQKHTTREEARKKVQALSGSQFTVLQLMVKGYSTRNIAELLHLSKRTIETHQHGIYQELNVHSQRGATLIGLASGLLSDPCIPKI